MKIVFIPYLPSLQGRRYNVAKTLVTQGHEVYFISWDMAYPVSFRSVLKQFSSAWRSYNYKNSDGIVIYKIRRIPFFAPLINGYLFKRQIRNIFNKYDANVVISQSYTNETEPPLNLPLVYDMVDDHVAYARIYGSIFYRIGFYLLGVKRVIKTQTKHAKLVLVVSDRLSVYAKKYNQHVVKIPNGVPNLIFSVKPNKKVLLTNKHSLIYVSTFGRWSSIIELINLVPQLKSIYPDIHLSLVGDGTELVKAKKLSKKLGVDESVTFYGRVNNPSMVYQLIADASICLNLSDENIFRDSASPVKVFEYCAFGKNIVSTNIAEVKGLKFPNIITYKAASKTPSFQNALGEALKLQQDNRAVQSVIARDYKWDTLTTQMVNAIEGQITI
jgi:glycosyltransferase involved in cell wall biosynthesis